VNHGVKDETCPLSTGGRTRRVQLVEAEGGGFTVCDLCALVQHACAAQTLSALSLCTAKRTLSHAALADDAREGAARAPAKSRTASVTSEKPAANPAIDSAPKAVAQRLPVPAAHAHVSGRGLQSAAQGRPRNEGSDPGNGFAIWRRTAAEAAEGRAGIVPIERRQLVHDGKGQHSTHCGDDRSQRACLHRRLHPCAHAALVGVAERCARDTPAGMRCGNQRREPAHAVSQPTGRPRRARVLLPGRAAAITGRSSARRTP